MRMLARSSAFGNAASMQVDGARSIAEQLHAGARDQTGAIVLEHVRRVVMRTPADARAVAWLHEVLESTAVSEQALLELGLTMDQLRALRLLRRVGDSHSDHVYLAHVELIAGAAGVSGRLARAVKIADLHDRALHPRLRPDGWSPPYERALRLFDVATPGQVGVMTAETG
jgi:hypothetical protein